jgi:putative ABC transport system ATP-binding protein
MIELTAVTKVYPGSTTPAVHDLNLTILRSEFVAIIGPSGSGKSTLLNLMGCLDRPTSGQLIFLGENTAKLSDLRLSRLRNRSVGFVFQMFNLVPEMTVRENVELPLVYAGVIRNRRTLTLEALDSVGIAHLAEKRAAILSGGEQQRAAIARALVTDPLLILADEPTGSVDTETADQVMALFGDLHDQGRSIVIVTHHPQVASVAHRVVTIEAGRLRGQVRPVLQASPESEHGTQADSGNDSRTSAGRLASATG